MYIFQVQDYHHKLKSNSTLDCRHHYKTRHYIARNCLIGRRDERLLLDEEEERDEDEELETLPAE